MKFAHLSDLHLGKSVNRYSMIEDQKHILKQAVSICVQEKVDAVVIAGDIYDRSQPSLEAIKLLDSLLTDFHQAGLPVLMISGNHDSGDRLEFVQDLLKNSEVYVQGAYQKEIEPIVFHDEYGKINFYLLPFLRPMYVNQWIEEEKDKVSTFEEAVKYTIDHMNLSKDERNVLIAHQFVTGAHVQEDGSEELLVGGLDEISYEVLSPFDYVALGHIHSFQKIAKRNIYYCGTLLPYSFSEANDQKGVLIVEIKEKNDVQVHQIPVSPLHNMTRLKGYYEDLLKPEMVEKYKNDYLEFTLLDENEILDAASRLKAYYPFLMRLQYKNQEMKNIEALENLELQKQMSPIELFDQFYSSFHQTSLTEEQKKYLLSLIEKIEEGGDSF